MRRLGAPHGIVGAEGRESVACFGLVSRGHGTTTD